MNIAASGLIAHIYDNISIPSHVGSTLNMQAYTSENYISQVCTHT